MGREQWLFLEYFSSVHEEKEIERDMYVDVNIKVGNMSISAKGNMTYMRKLNLTMYLVKYLRYFFTARTYFAEARNSSWGFFFFNIPTNPSQSTLFSSEHLTEAILGYSRPLAMRQCFLHLKTWRIKKNYHQKTKVWEGVCVSMPIR